MHGAKSLLLMLSILLIAGCGNLTNDLNPSGANKVPTVLSGTTGPAVGQNAPDFTLFDSLGNSVTLSSVVSSPSTSAVVLYFTMWCPICVTDMTDIRDSFIPNFPNVKFFAVDYVDGSVAAARNQEIANGFQGSGFTVLADTTDSVSTLYGNATMGTTVVIDNSGVVRMNELYKHDKLQGVLGGLP